MKNIKLFAFLMLISTILFSSCQKETFKPTNPKTILKLFGSNLDSTNSLGKNELLVELDMNDSVVDFKYKK